MSHHSRWVYWLWITLFFANAETGVAKDKPDKPVVDPPRTTLRLGFVPGDAFFPVKLADPTIDVVGGLSVLDVERRDDIEAEDDADPENVGLLDRDNGGLSKPETDGAEIIKHEVVAVQDLDIESPPTEMLFDYNYARVKFYPAFLKYFGFARLRLHGLTETDHNTLKELATLAGFEGNRIDEDRGLVNFEINERTTLRQLVIVNRDFPWDKYHFFQRYNEHWMHRREQLIERVPERMQKQLAPIHKRMKFYLMPGYYQSHVNTVEAVTEDWHHAADVPGLRVDFPVIERKKVMSVRPLKLPVSIDFKDAAVVAFPIARPERIYERRMNSTFYVATKEGVSRYRWVMEGWAEGYSQELVEEVMYKAGENDDE